MGRRIGVIANFCAMRAVNSLTIHGKNLPTTTREQSANEEVSLK